MLEGMEVKDITQTYKYLVNLKLSEETIRDLIVTNNEMLRVIKCLAIEDTSNWEVIKKHVNTIKKANKLNEKINKILSVQE